MGHVGGLALGYVCSRTQHGIRRMVQLTDSKRPKKEQVLDLIHFIRSIQHIEGNTECFGKANEHCDQKDCLWREYCLKEKE